MGIKITLLSQQAPVKRVSVDRRLWITKDGRRLVEDGHPEAAILFCAPGRPVPESEFNKYELLGEAEVTGREAGPEAEGKAKPKPKPRGKQQPKPRGKQQPKPKDKAVAGPSEEKATNEEPKTEPAEGSPLDPGAEPEEGGDSQEA